MTRQSVREDRGARAPAEGGGAASPHGEMQQPEARITRIARRAHEIYTARGGTEGKALDDWLQAEREIDAELDGEGGS
jgi:hypothetical protein